MTAKRNPMTGMPGHTHSVNDITDFDPLVVAMFASLSTVVIGSIVFYPFNDVPMGYLRMNGQTVQHDDYPSLGLKFGSIAGGSFIVPDWQNTPIFGASVTNSANTVSGSDTVNLSHNHTFSATTSSSGSHSHTVSTASSTDGAHVHAHAHTHGMSHTHQVDPPTTNTTSAGSHNHGGVTGAAANNAGLIAIGVTTFSQPSHTHTITSEPAHTHSVDVVAFTSGAASSANTGSESTANTDSSGSHSHSVSATSSSDGAHTHGVSGTTGTELSTIDKKPRRAYAWILIKAI